MHLIVDAQQRELGNVRVGIITVFTDYHRRGAHNRGPLQPQIGPLIAALLPDDAEIDVVNDVWDEPDWTRAYDLLFISALHSDFDRARQISHYWRRRGAKTVLGGPLASVYPTLCQPFFDAIVVGDAESTVPRLYRDFAAGALEPVYRGAAYDPLAVPTPRMDLLADRQIFPLALEATRGCPFTCDFCSLTGVGTRFHHPHVGRVVRDIREGQRMLAGKVAWWRRRMVAFMDNNIGGNPRWLAELCAALEPLGIRWASCITFNVLRDESMLDRMSASGCRLVYVGLESFNPAALADMHKRQNVLDDVRRVIDQCRARGILLTAGLMLSPTVDTLEYIDRVPAYLRESGLHVPTYIAIETPIPGTPHFRRLAESGAPALLPNAMLRDFNGYTLVTRPQHASPEDFVAAYRRIHAEVYSLRTRLRKVAADAAALLPNGHALPALVGAGNVLGFAPPMPVDRTLIAGTDKVPPERVPLTDADFASEAERAAIIDPWPVTDAAGRVAAHWLAARPVYLPKGRIAITHPSADTVQEPDLDLPELPGVPDFAPQPTG